MLIVGDKDPEMLPVSPSPSLAVINNVIKASTQRDLQKHLIQVTQLEQEQITGWTGSVYISFLDRCLERIKTFPKDSKYS